MSFVAGASLREEDAPDARRSLADLIRPPLLPQKAREVDARGREQRLKEPSLNTKEWIERILTVAHTVTSAVLLIDVCYGMVDAAPLTVSQVIDALQKGTALFAILPFWMLLLRTRKIYPMLLNVVMEASLEATEKGVMLENLHQLTHQYLVSHHNRISQMHLDILHKLEDMSEHRIDIPPHSTTLS
jgi:hypothetical protein